MPVLVRKDVQGFIDIWWAWWRSLQPAWRRPGNSGPMEQRKYGNDWTSMNVSGPNGWLGIAATLFWWGKAAVAMEAAAKEKWIEAVCDSVWMLKGLLEFVGVEK